MAIEIKIPKEVNKYEAKLIGPFTKRETAALVVAAPIWIASYNLLKPHVSFDVIIIVLLIEGSIAWLFGWSKFYGMRFEKFLKNVFVSAFIAPSKRLYRTENYYALLAEEIRKEEQLALENENPKKKKKKKYRRSSTAIR